MLFYCFSKKHFLFNNLLYKSTFSFKLRFVNLRGLPLKLLNWPLLLTEKHGEDGLRVLTFCSKLLVGQQSELVKIVYCSSSIKSWFICDLFSNVWIGVVLRVGAFQMFFGSVKQKIVGTAFPFNFPKVLSTLVFSHIAASKWI